MESSVNTPIFGVIRHPFQRIASAIHSVFATGQPAQRIYEARFNDWHIRPQAPAFHGLRVEILKFERLTADWERLVRNRFPEIPNLPRLGGNQCPDWQDVDIDWDSLRQRYHDDFVIWGSL